MSDDDDSMHDYAVGKYRPPKEYRFRKGISGNPSGARRKKPNRKQGRKNLRAEIIGELEQKIPVTENGRRRTIPRRAALAKKLVADALNGDAKARDQLLKLANQADHTQSEAEDLIGAAKDVEILERFRAEIIANQKARSTDND